MVQTAKAHWVTQDMLGWTGADPEAIYRLYYSATGEIAAGLSTAIQDLPSIPVSVDRNGMPQSVLEKFPFLKHATALSISDPDLVQVRRLLKGELLVAKIDNTGIVDATSLQLAGVLDDLFYFNGELGAHFSDAVIQFRLWAPTARSVRLFVYDNPDSEISAIYPMVEGDAGVWETSAGDASWLNRKYYLYEVEVFSRVEGGIVNNVVTDPYSSGLSPDSLKSLVVDFDAPCAKPALWGLVPKPELASPADIVLYELHIRDFSVFDETVPEKDRGKYTAFGHIFSNGMLHLWSLAAAGLTHVHLLPSFDFTSVPDLTWQQKTPKIGIPIPEPDSPEPQRAISMVKDQDGYNWGYDPYHYGAPEGSYSTDLSGITRIREFREMVESLHLIGLRVVMDVVYTHTAAAGQDPFSVLDKVVPGYYYRLDGDGDFYTSTCCPNTASEHRMFLKLMLDTLKIWVKQYRVDGFRFDLMGFSFKNNMLQIKEALHEIDPTIYLYGEGWDFGEVANNARGENATQINMAGTGIGTFSDRGRDTIRGGRPFDRGVFLVANQGFINGLCYDKNELGNGTLQQLLDSGDLVKLALAGTLENYELVDNQGALVKGLQLTYSGRPAGYGRDPLDVINYVSAHDNHTLFDINQYKLPTGTAMIDRVRVNNLGLALVGLAQGIPFFHAGDEILRSKSFDRNSYNSGDWFNRLDWTYRTNNFAVGLPPEEDNGSDWPVMGRFLKDPSLKPGFTEIYSCHLYFRDILRIRKSTPLFRLKTGEEVRESVRFYNTGSEQQPALIVMAIFDRPEHRLDPAIKSVVVLFNVDKIDKTIDLPYYAGTPLELHPVLQRSKADPVLKQSQYNCASATFYIPARTIAVFLERDR